MDVVYLENMEPNETLLRRVYQRGCELERELATVRSAHRQALLEARAALEYYANPENWSYDDWSIKSVSNEYANAGQQARAALARITEVLG